MYTLVFVFGCKIRKFYWNRNDLTPTFLRFCGNTSWEEIDTLLRKRLRGYHTDIYYYAHRKHRDHRNLKWNQWERMVTWTRIARIERIVLEVHRVLRLYINNGINGKRNGKPEMDTSMHKIVKTKEPKDKKDLMFNL